jgi:hypothetical protein
VVAPPIAAGYGSAVNTTATLVAIVIAVAGATFILARLQRSSRRTRTNDERAAAPLAEDPAARVAADDAMFRLLSFQGGSVPGNLGPIMEELRRNGIEVDEATLRRKLTDGAALVEKAGERQDLDDVRRRGRPATATLLSATEETGGDIPAGLGAPWKPLVVELEHRLPDGSPVHVRRTALIPTDKLDLMVEGAAIPVRVDDEDPRLLTIEWEIT